MRGLIRPSSWLVGAALSVILPLSAVLAQQDDSQEVADPVPIRGGEHGDYSRIVFDWEAAIPYRVSAGPGRLVVSFDELRDADVRLVNPAILENIAAIEQISEPGQPLSIAITISENTRVRDFNLGPKLVVDIVDDPIIPAEPEVAEAQSNNDSAEAANDTDAGNTSQPNETGQPVDTGSVEEGAPDDSESQTGDETPDSSETPESNETPELVEIPDSEEPAESADDGETNAEPGQAQREELVPSADSVVEKPDSVAEEELADDSGVSGQAADQVDEVATASDGGAGVEEAANAEAPETASLAANQLEGQAEGAIEETPVNGSGSDQVNESSSLAGETAEAAAPSEPLEPETDAGSELVTASDADTSSAAPASENAPESAAEPNPLPITDDAVDDAPVVADQQDISPQETPLDEPEEAVVAALPTDPDQSAPDESIDALAVIEKEIEQAEDEQALEEQSQQQTAAVTEPAAEELEVAEPAPQAVPAGRLDADVVQQQAIFDPGVPSLLSVFRRGDALWVVIGADSPLDPTSLAAQGSVGFGPAEIAAADGGAALRYVVDADLHPTVELDGNRWIVRLIDAPQAHNRLVEVVPQPEFPLGPRVLVQAEGVQGLVRVADPEIGDVLVVAPLQVPAMGLAHERRFVEVRLLPSIQGLVAELLADSVTMRIVRQGVEITTSQGLILSPVGDRRASAVNTFGAPIPDSLLRVGDWQGPPAQFNKRRQALQRNVAVADDDNLPRARLDLARFYFSHGYGSEAAGLLSLMQTSDETLPDRPDFRALEGAAKLIVGDPEDSLAAFDHDELRGREEIALWRGAAHADLADWPAAYEDFALSRPLMGAYPAPFADYFYFRAGRAALAMGELEELGTIIELMSSSTDEMSDEWAMTDYFRGMIALEIGDLAEAEENLKRAARSDDPKIHILASLALVDQGTARGTLTAEEAADELESLRYAWRGDEIEFDISEKLGDKYWEIGRYHDAVTNWQRAVENFPDHMPAMELGKSIPTRLADLIVEPRADGGLNPLRAAALYSEFKDLLPQGDRGVDVAMSVVDKLVSIDLLGQASQMLEDLTRNQLEGETAVRTALREAGLHLLQDKPSAAMKTLDWTEDVLEKTGAPQDLEAERSLLRADTLARLEQPEQALSVLSDLDSRLASAARVNIAWKAGLWQQAGEALAELVGVPPDGDEAMSQAQADTVINYGIALALADDSAGLSDLAEMFGPAIENTDRAAVFRILTRGEAPLQPIRDLAAVRRQTSEIELFRDFLDGYRESATTVAATEG